MPQSTQTLARDWSAAQEHLLRLIDQFNSDEALWREHLRRQLEAIEGLLTDLGERQPGIED